MAVNRPWTAAGALANGPAGAPANRPAGAMAKNAGRRHREETRGNPGPAGWWQEGRKAEKT